MTGRVKIHIALLCGVLFLSGCVSLNQDIIDSLQSENDGLQHRLVSAERDADDLRVLVDQQRKELLVSQQRLTALDEENRSFQTRLQEYTAQQADVVNSRNLVEQRLRNELEQYQAKLEMTAKGLVVTFLSEVLFDSGSATLRSDADEGLHHVARILNEEFPEGQVVVEGHTDSEPIAFSGWPSNWELSAMRALSVVHFFVNECAVDPARLSASAFSEFSPKESNDTSAGRRQNRRVEIVIMPRIQRQNNL